MCTGDNLDTAKAIAINAGILPHDYLQAEESMKNSIKN
jgi:magnesium-transporting ATPase (P-type)